MCDTGVSDLCLSFPFTALRALWVAEVPLQSAFFSFVALGDKLGLPAKVDVPFLLMRLPPRLLRAPSPGTLDILQTLDYFGMVSTSFML